MVTLEFLDRYDFFVGVPDSQLRQVCDYLVEKYNSDRKHHIIAANEGNAVAIAAGYHMATKKVPVVYMQNSGEGNAINPIASLLNEKVYAIPMLFIIGWRGEPGVHDEPQHIFQGEITTKLLDDLDIKYFILSNEKTNEELDRKLKEFDYDLKNGKQVAIIVKKNSIINDKKVKYENTNTITREDAIREIVKIAGEDIVVSTTGKASRELFEIREERHEKHEKDFLTVGCMGHASSIALGIALQKESRVWIIDGDGAALMHLGAMPILAAIKPKNVVHVIVNNEAHETVGGMELNAKCNYKELGKVLGYDKTYSTADLKELEQILIKVKGEEKLTLIEIKCSIFSRADLGRPTIKAVKNKENFMEFLSNKK